MAKTADNTGKYTKLISNTLLFGVSSFGSKLLSFFMTALYTRVMSDGEYGIATVIIDTCNMILPIMHLCVPEAIIRFGIDGKVKKKNVFTVALTVVAGGYLVMLLLSPLLRFVPLSSDLGITLRTYPHLIYLFILTSAMRNIIAQFVRALGKVRIFALDGLFTTLVTIGFNLLYLIKFQLGVTGFVLSTICADGLSALVLFFGLRLYRYISYKGLGWGIAGDMLRYCVPLVPTALFWWVTNLSDHYMILHFWGSGATGIYTAAGKLPGMMTIVSTFFIQAWQLSAFQEFHTAEGETFFSNVFKSYYTFIFLVASGIIWWIRPVLSIFFGPDFQNAWQYVPFLVLAVSFSCLVTFLGTIYNAAKHNAMVTFTTFVGAAVNVVMNLLLIPRIGLYGAAIATFTSYLLVFVIRAVDTRRYLTVRMQPLRILLTLALLLFQCWLSLSQIPYNFFYQFGVLLLIILCNLSQILFLFTHLLQIVLRRKKES